jgi:hypothetical protein
MFNWCAFVVLILAAVVCAASGTDAQPAQGQTLPSAAPKPADSFIFDSDAVIVVLTVAPESTADFEAMLTRVKEILAKTEKPDRKKQAAHWKVTKGESLVGGMQLYFMTVENVVKGVTYSPFQILAEGGMTATEVKTKFGSILKGMDVIGLKPVVDMGG